MRNSASHRRVVGALGQARVLGTTALVVMVSVIGGLLVVAILAIVTGGSLYFARQQQQNAGGDAVDRGQGRGDGHPAHLELGEGQPGREGQDLGAGDEAGDYRTVTYAELTNPANYGYVASFTTADAFDVQPHELETYDALFDAPAAPAEPDLE